MQQVINLPLLQMRINGAGVCLSTDTLKQAHSAQAPTSMHLQISGKQKHILP
jgi:hypothetical protein